MDDCRLIKIIYILQMQLTDLFMIYIHRTFSSCSTVLWMFSTAVELTIVWKPVYIGINLVVYVCVEKGEIVSLPCWTHHYNYFKHYSDILLENSLSRAPFYLQYSPVHSLRSSLSLHLLQYFRSFLLRFDRLPPDSRITWILLKARSVNTTAA